MCHSYLFSLAAADIYNPRIRLVVNQFSHQPSVRRAGADRRRIGSQMKVVRGSVNQMPIQKTG
jgi:hypothetical protein